MSCSKVMHDNYAVFDTIGLFFKELELNNIGTKQNALDGDIHHSNLVNTFKKNNHCGFVYHHVDEYESAVKQINKKDPCIEITINLVWDLFEPVTMIDNENKYCIFVDKINIIGQQFDIRVEYHGIHTTLEMYVPVCTNNI